VREQELYGFQAVTNHIVVSWVMAPGNVRTRAQAVSRRLPTAAGGVRAHVRTCGIYGGQSGTGADFLRVLRFPLPILIPPSAPHSSSIIRGWYNRPVSGRRAKWTRSHPISRKLKITMPPCRLAGDHQRLRGAYYFQLLGIKSEDAGSVFLLNVANHLPGNTVS
jgi:hypothetical protein